MRNPVGSDNHRKGGVQFRIPVRECWMPLANVIRGGIGNIHNVRCLTRISNLVLAHMRKSQDGPEPP